MRGRAQYADPERLNRLIEPDGENTVPVVEQELILMIDACHFAQLLQRPDCGRVSGDIAVNQATSAVLDDDEDVEHPEARRDGQAEVAGENPLSVKTQEGRPAQILSRPARRTPGHVLAHRAWRDPDSELQQQFVGDALLAPEGILRGHPADQALQLNGKRRTARTRPQAPQHSPGTAVPAKQRIRPNDDQCVAPIEEP